MFTKSIYLSWQLSNTTTVACSNGTYAVYTALQLLSASSSTSSAAASVAAHTLMRTANDYQAPCRVSLPGINILAGFALPIACLTGCHWNDEHREQLLVTIFATARRRAVHLGVGPCMLMAGNKQAYVVLAKMYVYIYQRRDFTNISFGLTDTNMSHQSNVGLTGYSKRQGLYLIKMKSNLQDNNLGLICIFASHCFPCFECDYFPAAYHCHFLFCCLWAYVQGVWT